MVKMVSAVLFSLTMPLAATAQTVAARSFEELQARNALSEGDALVITYSQDGSDEQPVARGSFVRLTRSAITVQPDSGEQLQIAESDVLRIARERVDSVWSGAIVGAGVGVAYSVLTSIWFCNSAWECEAGPTAGYILVISGLGFAIGAGIDKAARNPREELVYLPSQGTIRPLGVSVFPILSRERKGVGIRFTW